ncbi:MAG: hypothetical protein K2N58_02745 [Treponemataceae bacterium]|nr:hypothetical protein [Treponemataceae bacterium]
MNKCKILFTIIIALFFIEFANAEKTATDYYKAGCKALNKGKIEKAEDKFLEAINVSLETVDKVIFRKSNFSTATFKYDIEKAGETTSKNDWRVYYYKGLLEANIIFDYKNSNYVSGEIENVSKDLAIATLKKSVSLYDNYQSHIVLYFLGVKGERNKAIQLAQNIGCNEAAGNIEYGIGLIWEKEENLEEALVHYKKSKEYLWKSETNEKIKNLSKIIEMIPKLKEQGITYHEYEKRQRQRATRQTWKNLSDFLLMGNYASYVPLEKGDRISVSQYLISMVDIDVVNGNYSYLFTATGASSISQCAYIITKRQLEIMPYSDTNLVMEPVVIQCEGTASYKRGVSVVNTYVFSLVE